MPDRLPLTYAGEIYDRTWRLYTGETRPTGVDLRYVHVGIEELFWRQGRYQEFDAAEFSLGAYIASLDDPDRPFTALPVFPSKAFRHGAVYVRTDGPTEPSELRGARIATPEWSMTASLWMRGILGEHYGVDLRQIRWFTGGVEEPGREEKSRVTPPPDFSVEPIGRERTLNEALVAGDVDALICARPPSSFTSGDPSVRRLFADHRAAEREYFAATGVLPVMHLVVVRRDVVGRHPWLANNLRHAFEAAQAPVRSELIDNAVSKGSLVWEAAYAAEEAQLFGDAFAHGIEANRPALEAICRYAFEQGFSERPVEVEDLFVDSTLTEARV